MRGSHRRLTRAGLAVAVLAVGGVLGTTSAALATDCGGLQAALSAAGTGATVTVDEGLVCTGPFTLPSTAITLTGAGSGATLQGGVGVRALSGVDVGSTLITNLTFSNASGSGGGGAVAITGNSAPVFSGDSFVANSTSGGPGGALYVDSTAVTGAVTVANSTFGDGTLGNRNHSSGGGGAVAIVASTSVVVTSSHFLANATDDVGGGGAKIKVNGGAGANVSDSVFDGNRLAGTAADLGGGGLRIDASTGTQLTLTGNTFDDNQIAASTTGQVANGAGAFLTSSAFVTPPTASLTNNGFDANSITGGSSSMFTPQGGGLATNQVALTSNSDRFTNNSIPDGVSNYARGAGVSLGTCVTSGTAPEDVLVQAVVAGNTVPGPELGAGVSSGCSLILAQTLLRVRQSTIAGNHSGGISAGVWGGPASSLVMENSILASNAGGSDLYGFSSTTVSYSDLCVGSSPPGPPPGLGNVCADPRLANPDAGDIFQTASSPTVDSGSNAAANGIATDYAGLSRVVDGDRNGTATVDIGADERRDTTTCARLSDEFNRAATGAVIRLADGQTCTGSYTLPAVKVSLLGDGAGATFEPASGRALYGNNIGASVFHNLTFTGGSGSPGGAIFIEGASTPIFDGVDFLDNHSSGPGGGLALDSTGGVGTITLTDAHFGDDTEAGSNSGSVGGGAAIYPGPSDVFITQSSFQKNTATDGAGGGLYLDRGTGDRDFKRVDIDHNVVQTGGGQDGRGGGAYIGASPFGSALTLAGVYFVENEIGPGTGELAGAGLFVQGSLPTDHVSQNYNRYVGNTFSDATNASRVVGAGQAVSNATVSIHEDQYLHNSIGPHGSAEAAGVGLSLDGCTTAFGGTTHLVLNDVFAHNSAADGAHGTVAVSCSAAAVKLNLINTTITANDVANTAGVWGDGDALLTLGNAIVFGNALGVPIAGFGSADVSYSDICDGSLAYAGDGNICADPVLLDIPSDDVHETPSSPTVDVGSNALIPDSYRFDYEGNDRIMDGDDNGTGTVDMGADEKARPVFQPAVPPPPVVIGPIGLPTSGPTAPPSTPAPAQVVAGVKVAGGTKPPAKPAKKKNCGDNTGPTSRFLNRLSHAARFKGSMSLTIRGKAAYKKCKSSDKGKIKRVNFTLRLVVGKSCRWLTKSRTLGPPQSCTRKRVFFTASGTTNWSFTLKGPFPAGRYLADVQAVDNLGNKERPGLHRNFRHFRIDGTRLKQGWTGTHPDDYTKRG